MLNKNKISNGVKLPAFLIKYFWDVDFSNLNAKEYPTFIIERILEHGDEKAVKWALTAGEIAEQYNAGAGGHINP